MTTLRYTISEVVMAGTRAPAGLGVAGRALWHKIADAFELDPAELALLLEACRTSDELGRLADALAVAEPMTEGSMGQPIVNPLFAAVREHRVVLNRLVVSLALPVEGEDAGRANRSPANRRAADTRYRREGLVGSRYAALRAVGED